MGALLVIAFKVGGDVRTILTWLGINVVITVLGSQFISWQAHLGGLLGGMAIAAMLVYAPRTRRTQVQALGLLRARRPPRGADRAAHGRPGLSARALAGQVPRAREAFWADHV